MHTHTHAQVAIVPAECAWAPYQSGLGCVLLSSDLVAGDGSIEGAMEAVGALAAAAARQFFGVLMLPPVCRSLYHHHYHRLHHLHHLYL